VTDIGRITVQDQPGPKRYQDPTSRTTTKNKPGVVMHDCNSIYIGGIGRRIVIPGWLGQNMRY
jgi:hypothetical protein